MWAFSIVIYGTSIPTFHSSRSFFDLVSKLFKSLFAGQ